MPQKVNMITADSDKRFIMELQTAIDEGWSPVWESFRTTVLNEPHARIVFNILLQINDTMAK